MIRILTDSSAGFTLDDVQKIGVEMGYIPISFEDADYLDQFNLNAEEFYAKLKTVKRQPKTSAINQAAFEEVFRDVQKKGDEMIVLGLSSGLSVTYEQAVKAKEAVGYHKIYVVNTLAVTGTLIALVMEAVRLRNAKMPAIKIVEEIEKLVPKVRLFAYVDTLKYLHMGGRLSGGAAVVGTLLNVKPSLTVEEGKLHSRSKSIGIKKAQASILAEPDSFHVDWTKPFYFVHANTLEECAFVKEQAQNRYNKLIDGGIWYIPATIAAHTGPGAVALIFFEQ